MMIPRITLLLTLWIWIIGFALVNFRSYFYVFRFLASCISSFVCCPLFGGGVHFGTERNHFSSRTQVKRISFRDINGPHKLAKKHQKLLITIKSAYKTIATSVLYLVTFLPCSVVFLTIHLKPSTRNDLLVWLSWPMRISWFHVSLFKHQSFHVFVRKQPVP